MGSKWVVSPTRILAVAVANGLLTKKEARSPKFRVAALEEAEHLCETWPREEGFGSTDLATTIRKVLAIAGVKTAFINFRLTRIEEA